MLEKQTDEPWYRDGLRFECTQCGDCCTGEPGYVWVDEQEIAALAARLEMDVDAFEHRFVRAVGLRKTLVEYPDGDCIFLDPETRGCTVYDLRPVQCRTWPFWDSTLENRRAWKETCAVCPGSGRGKLYTFEEIEIRRKEREV
ncbi:YkgJ family cysteine cluster protein [Candidatus Laterigemmans baculatus]|uniref:YkgJ family cysteine cluster protein n=1 Tax=Candidatus Laterigemmans baculatus TaxID=2770505 RepID=UPI0013DA2FE7|nr:YkgJ family cysteine cluster protein [Candidatus Laterigemmans baculatus]